MASTDPIMETSAHCYSSPSAQTWGALRLYEDKLVWEPHRGTFWPTKFLTVPAVEVHPADIVTVERCRVGFGQGVRVRTTARGYLFLIGEGSIPFATKRIASKWLDAILDLAGGNSA